MSSYATILARSLIIHICVAGWHWVTISIIPNVVNYLFFLACLLACFMFNQVWKPAFSKLFKKLDVVSLARCKYHWNTASSKLILLLNSFSALLLSLLHDAFYPPILLDLEALLPPYLLLSVFEIILILLHLRSHSVLVFFLLLCSLSLQPL